MKKEINVEDFKKNCQTGDILLYNTQFWYSKLIEYFSIQFIVILVLF